MVSMDNFQSSIISPTATILSVLFCGFILHLLTKKFLSKHGKKRYHPIGSTIFNQLINFHWLHYYMTDLAGKYKTYRLISPFRNEIYTSDPVNVEYILKTNFDNYGKDKIAQEIKEATTEKEDATDITVFAANVSEEALEKMQYLHAALTETLRLYPAVAMDAKTCFLDDTLPDGFSVNKGDLVAYQSYAMGRMKFIWGDDAEEYKPERWFDGDGFFREENPFKFIAFLAGLRICLGKEFSYKQMKIFYAVLFSTLVMTRRLPTTGQ